MLTQEELKTQLNYNPDTGIFTRKIRSAHCVQIGDVAGTKCTKGYIQLRIKQVKYSAHKLAWLYIYGYTPTLQIDHINGIKDDNRLLNLREATQSQNMANRPLLKRNTSGYVNVNFNKSKNKWFARCAVNGVRHFIGEYDTAESASIAYKEFAQANHGNFYCET